MSRRSDVASAAPGAPSEGSGRLGGADSAQPRPPASTEERLVSELIALMESGQTPWRRPWRESVGPHVNLVSGRPYRGSNPLLLTLGMHLRGSHLPYWCGWGEARRLGLAPRRGSRGVMILRPLARGQGMLPPADGLHPDGAVPSAGLSSAAVSGAAVSGAAVSGAAVSGEFGPAAFKRPWEAGSSGPWSGSSSSPSVAARRRDPGQGGPGTSTIEASRPGVGFRPVVVFNAADLVGDGQSARALAERIARCRASAAQASRPESERLGAAESVLAAWPVPVLEGAMVACYRPAADCIELPEASRFESAAARLATWAHEAVHSSGHRKRLNRDLSAAFGSPDYAREELVAELGAVLLGERLEIGSDTANHAAYLSHWCELLRQEPRLLLQVLADARRAADLIAPERVAAALEDQDQQASAPGMAVLPRGNAGLSSRRRPAG